MAQITYQNKVALNVNPEVADINKVKDSDMNEIKNVVNANETKILIAVADTAPAQCSTGDLYYNTTNNKIYTAIGTNTWSSTGTTPTANTMYILFDSQTAYAYDGNELISVGGGSDVSDLIVVGTDTPTENTKLQIESNDLDPQGIYITNVHSESTTTGYSAAYTNARNTYSTSETFTGKYWINGKPIYRKVITGTKTGTTNVIDTIPNITIVKFEGTVSTSTIQLQLGTYLDATNNNSSIYYNTSTGEISLYSPGVYNGRYYAIVEYVKNN